MNLAEYILNNPQKQNIFLISDGGSGKTYQLVFAYEKILQKSKTEKIIPMYVPAQDYGKLSAFEGTICQNGLILGATDFVTRYIIKEYLGDIKTKENDLTPSERLRKMFETSDYRFIIFLDGLNETSIYPDGLYSEMKLLSEYTNVTIVATSRYDVNTFGNFCKLRLEKLNEVYITNRVHNFSRLNQKLQQLLKRPFYLKKYLEIKNEDKNALSGAAELLKTYFNDLTNRTQHSVGDISYKEFSERVVKEFFPQFVYDQMNHVSYLIFDELNIITAWNHFALTHILNVYKDVSFCVKVLENLGIIIKSGSFYIFSHEIYYTYFAAEYVSKKLEENQMSGDALLVNINDNNVLLMLGEMLGEHLYASRETLGEEKSPVELKLDKYRNIFDGSATRIVAKYIEIMRLCRNNRCTADFSSLDLQNVVLYGFQWNGSKFNDCILPAYSFEEPIINGIAPIAYYDEINNIVIIMGIDYSNHYKMIVLDSYFNTITVIDDLYNSTIIKIYANCISIHENGNDEIIFDLHTRTFRSVEKSKCLITIPANTEDNEPNINCDEIINFPDTIPYSIYDSNEGYWNVAAYQHKDNTLKLFNNGCRLILAQLDQEVIDDDLNIELKNMRISRILAHGHLDNPRFFLELEDFYNTAKKSGIYFEDTDLFIIDKKCYDAYTRHLLCKGGLKEIEKTCIELYDNSAQSTLSSFTTLYKKAYKYLHNELFLYQSDVFKDLQPKSKQGMVVQVCDSNYACVYFDNMIYILSLDDNKVKINTIIQGKIMYESLHINGDIVTFLSWEDDEIFIINYNCRTQNQTIQYRCGGKAVMHIVNDIKKYSRNILEDSFGVPHSFVRINEHMLIFYSSDWKNSDKLFIHDIERVQTYEINLFEEGLFDLVFAQYIKLYDYSLIFFRYNHISKITINFEPFSIKKEWTIQDLGNTDIQKCDFTGAVMRLSNGDNPIPKEILFNT